MCYFRSTHDPDPVFISPTQDLIRDCIPLVNFYPDTPKDDALRLVAYPGASAALGLGGSQSLSSRALLQPLPRHEEEVEGGETVSPLAVNGAGNGSS